MDLGSYVISNEEIFTGTIYAPTGAMPVGFAEEVEMDYQDTEMYDANGTDFQQVMREGLDDVGHWNERYAHLVVRSGELFFAKVAIVFSDKEKAVRCMYLYCAGWRRRLRTFLDTRFRTTDQRVYSAELVWKFAARAAVAKYGNTARLLVVMPRDGVDSTLTHLGARMWHCCAINPTNVRELLMRELIVAEIDETIDPVPYRRDSAEVIAEIDIHRLI